MFLFLLGDHDGVADLKLTGWAVILLHFILLWVYLRDVSNFKKVRWSRSAWKSAVVSRKYKMLIMSLGEYF